MKFRILKLLNSEERLSTSRIAGTLGISYDYTLKLLEELKKEKKVKSQKETLATYWEINKEKIKSTKIDAKGLKNSPDALSGDKQ